MEMHMKTMAAFWFLLVSSMASLACDCFPQEARDKAAREALDGARLAVYARVTAIEASGQVKLLVLESFKGPPAQSVIEVRQDTSKCAMKAAFVDDEEILLLAYEETVTACHKYAKDNFMVDSFRRLTAK
jgi:hypothetical protein